MESEVTFFMDQIIDFYGIRGTSFYGLLWNEGYDLSWIIMASDLFLRNERYHFTVHHRLLWNEIMDFYGIRDTSFIEYLYYKPETTFHGLLLNQMYIFHGLLWNQRYLWL